MLLALPFSHDPCCHLLRRTQVKLGAVRPALRIVERRRKHAVRLAHDELADAGAVLARRDGEGLLVIWRRCGNCVRVFFNLRLVVFVGWVLVVESRYSNLS